jgi:hypothetical protein
VSLSVSRHPDTRRIAQQHNVRGSHRSLIGREDDAANVRDPGDTRTLWRYLTDRAVLVVLDNCEHLVDSCASLAERLLSDCPQRRSVSRVWIASLLAPLVNRLFRATRSLLRAASSGRDVDTNADRFGLPQAADAVIRAS